MKIETTDIDKFEEL